MSAQLKGNRKQWRPGDLVLHEADPKTHAMLMEILEVRENEARAVYLDGKFRDKTSVVGAASQPRDSWHPLEAFHDPALFLKTEEFLQTLREHASRRFRFNSSSS